LKNASKSIVTLQNSPWFSDRRCHSSTRIRPKNQAAAKGPVFWNYSNKKIFAIENVRIDVRQYTAEVLDKSVITVLSVILTFPVRARREVRRSQKSCRLWTIGGSGLLFLPIDKGRAARIRPIKEPRRNT
jgi:hypothetical protein